MTDKELKTIKTCIMAGAEKIRRTNPHKGGLAQSAWNNACLHINHIIGDYLREYTENGMIKVESENENI